MRSRRIGYEGCRLRRVGSSRRFTSTPAGCVPVFKSTLKDTSYDHKPFAHGDLQSLAFKAIRRLYPEYPLWRDFPYEYVHDRLAIDVINGSELLRNWVDDSKATPADLEALAAPDEQQWAQERADYLIY